MQDARRTSSECLVTAGGRGGKFRKQPEPRPLPLPAPLSQVGDCTPSNATKSSYISRYSLFYHLSVHSVFLVFRFSLSIISTSNFYNLSIRSLFPLLLFPFFPDAHLGILFIQSVFPFIFCCLFDIPLLTSLYIHFFSFLLLSPLPLPLDRWALSCRPVAVPPGHDLLPRGRSPADAGRGGPG